MNTLTYLINLDGSDQRLESATKQLDDIGWPFERVAAYDGRGKDLSDFVDYDDQQTRKNLGRSLLSAEIGCYLSHYECAKRFLRTDADFLVVLEDDMTLSTDFKTIVTETLDFLYANPETSHSEISNPETSNPKTNWHLINLAAKKKKLAKDIASFNEHTLWHAYYFPIRGLGLIWSRKGAEAFIKVAKPITMPVDIFFQKWLSHNGKGLGIWPALVKPLGLDSDILGTQSSQNIKRKDKENRDLSYNIKKHKRMWQNKTVAVKNLYLTK